jgi:anti-sigma B factor antagonist
VPARAASREVTWLVSEDPLILSSDSLQFSVSQESGYAVVSVAGEIDAGSERQFRDALTWVLVRGVVRIVVDLAGVEFMASAGIGVLMGVRRVLANEGGSLVLASPHGEVAQVLSMSGVSKAIPVAASVADAVARLPSGPQAAS